MTEHEMRVRLAEAMGWTRTDEWMRGIPPGMDAGYEDIPDPLESDRDAARLRAWCVGQGWEVEAWGDPYHAMLGLHRIGRGEDSLYRRVTLSECRVRFEDEPDPCRRERLALCRAVCQALEVEHV